MWVSSEISIQVCVAVDEQAVTETVGLIGANCGARREGCAETAWPGRAQTFRHCAEEERQVRGAAEMATVTPQSRIPI